jgi:hypothetical protein
LCIAAVVASGRLDPKQPKRRHRQPLPQNPKKAVAKEKAKEVLPAS